MTELTDDPHRRVIRAHRDRIAELENELLTERNRREMEWALTDAAEELRTSASGPGLALRQRIAALLTQPIAALLAMKWFHTLIIAAGLLVTGYVIYDAGY